MSPERGTPFRGARLTVATLISMVAGVVLIWAGLIAALSLVQQVLAGFFDLSQTRWTQAFNPWVWFGVESIGGTGGIFDALLGGPGAPGGTVSRYITFMLFAFIAAACYLAITTLWSWAKRTDFEESSE